jgi:hypothetical protein
MFSITSAVGNRRNREIRPFSAFFYKKDEGALPGKLQILNIFASSP